jgi:hypothetical protein
VLERERGILFQCRNCGFLVSNMYAGRAHGMSHPHSMEMKVGMGCSSKACVQPRQHYRRARFVKTQQDRMRRLLTGDAALIVPPGQRKELERSVLDRNDVDSALAEIESLLKYA